MRYGVSKHELELPPYYKQCSPVRPASWPFTTAPRSKIAFWRHGVWSAAETVEALSLGLKRDPTKRGASAISESSSNSSEEPNPGPAKRQRV